MSAAEQPQSAAKDARAGYRRPGRPRSAEADAAIIGATIGVLLEDGYAGLSMERVAERAGVSKATIYRRYANKSELVIGAVRAASDTGQVELPDTGDIVSDVAAFTDAALAASEGDAQRLLSLPRLIVETAISDRALFEEVSNLLVWMNQEPVKRALERAIDRGQLRPDLDLDLAADMLVGAFVFQMMRTGGQGMEAASRAKQSMQLMVEGLERKVTDGG